MSAPAPSLAASPTVTPADPAQWDELLAAFPQRTVFHRRGWLDLLAAAHGLTPLLLRVDAGSRCQALWPVLTLQKGPFRVAGSPLPGWSTAYLGPLVAEGADAAAVLAPCLAHPTLRSSSYVELRTLQHPTALDLAPFGYEQLATFATYLLDLRRSEDELWKGVDGKCRNLVRKAEKKGLAVREETDASFVGDFHAQSLAVFAKAGLQPPYTRAFVQALWERLHPAGLASAWSSFAEGRRIATVVLLHDDRTAYYWAGASDPAALQLAPNNALLWAAIRAARARGATTFDFVSSSGDAGRFKRSFGPEEKTVAVRWGRSRTFVEGLLKRAYERFARWRRRSVAAAAPASPARAPSGSELAAATEVSMP